MKNKAPFVIELLIGILFACIGLFLAKSDYYSTLIFSIGVGLCSASCVQLFRFFYYGMPQNKEKYEAKKRAAHIDSIDERKVFLRMKAGALANQLMAFLFLLLSFALAWFHVDAWIIALTFGMFALQLILGVTIYKYLERQM